VSPPSKVNMPTLASDSLKSCITRHENNGSDERRKIYVTCRNVFSPYRPIKLINLNFFQVHQRRRRLYIVTKGLVICRSGRLSPVVRSSQKVFQQQEACLVSQTFDIHFLHAAAWSNNRLQLAVNAMAHLNTSAIRSALWLSTN
jgi:hypothetical protein